MSSDDGNGILPSNEEYEDSNFEEKFPLLLIINVKKDIALKS
jgi:hypothetical protein